MQEQSFEELAREAAAGLKSDPELFLDVKQELQSHLEDKAQCFASQGNSEEESAALSRQSFGSPMDVAAELLDANRQRMKWRSLMRLALGALIVPIAILLALYLGYNGLARISSALSIFDSYQRLTIPEIPGPFVKKNYIRFSSLTDSGIFRSSMFYGDNKQITDAHKYWLIHQAEPESYIYYAYYASTTRDAWDTKNYVEIMRYGEKIEPDNALYNIFLAHHYLSEGLRENYIKGDDYRSDGYQISNRDSFNAGMAELFKAAGKPYLTDYQDVIIQKKLSLLPIPKEYIEYQSQFVISNNESNSTGSNMRELLAYMPDIAKILIAEKQNEKAEMILDLWKPLAILNLHKEERSCNFSWNVFSNAIHFTHDSEKLYKQLGRHDKGKEVQSINKKLTKLRKELLSIRDTNEIKNQEIVKKYGNAISPVFFNLRVNYLFNADDFTPIRMFDYNLIEEIAIQLFIILLLYTLVVAIIKTIYWRLRLRNANAIPILLFPPLLEIFKAVFFGIIIPVALYWIYMQYPEINGRNMSLHYSYIKFYSGLLILLSIMYWVPVYIIRKYTRKRCEILGIQCPKRKDEIFSYIIITTIYLIAVGLVVINIYIANKLYFSTDLCLHYFSFIEMLRYQDKLLLVLSILAALSAIIYTIIKHNKYGLYYSSITRSMMPIFSFMIISIVIFIQPWQNRQETKWLQKDTLIYHMVNKSNDSIDSPSDVKAAQSFSKMIIKIIEDKPDKK